jgi:dolichol kinase
MLTKTTYLEGTVAGAAVGTLAAWLYVPFVPALITSSVAMVVEAGELRVGSHYVDDNLVVPIVSALTLWVVRFAIPF